MQVAVASPPRPASGAAAVPLASPARCRRRLVPPPPRADATATTTATSAATATATHTAGAVLDLRALAGGAGGGGKDQRRGGPRVPDWLDTPLGPASRPPSPDQQQQQQASAPAAAGAARPPPYAHGSIEIVTGPMFSGKSTALLDRVSALAAEGRNVAVVKPRRDDRYARNFVVSHALRAARCYCVSGLLELRPLIGEVAWRELDAVCVDEAQFFDDLVAFALDASEGGGGAEGAGAGGGDAACSVAPGGAVRPKAVVVAGLSGDFRRRPFGRVAELLPLADRVSALRASCFSCGEPAPFSLRLSLGGGGGLKQQQLQRQEQVLVGGEEAYRPACRPCYKRYSEAA